MKNIFFGIALILSINVFAQERTEKTNVFVRVYDLQGKLISKGKIFFFAETSLHLKSNKESIEIPVSNIGLIKTKQSAGNNVLAGALLGATALGFIAAADLSGSDSDWFNPSPGEMFVAGAIFGGVAGAVIGVITTLFKNSITYEINGDETKWKEFKETITGLKQY